MSLQHQNNKSLPKHLQHARIQKEEDDEPWISGEELCTEGEASSDEDANTKFGDFKRKLKAANSGQSSASSIKSRNWSSSNGSVREKSDNNSDPKSLKSGSVEWRPKRDDEDSLYDIKAERLDTEMKWKTTLEELQQNKNLYKSTTNSYSTSTTKLDTNQLLYDFQNPGGPEYNFEDLINHSEFITDNIVTLDKEIETFGTILEGCRKDRIICERDICNRIKMLNICKVTSQSTDKFHKICNFKRERTSKRKRRKTSLNPRVYSRANKFQNNNNNKAKGSTKMDETPTKLTKDQSNRLEDILAEEDNIEDEMPNCFKHTNSQLANIAIIEGKLKTLQEKSSDADLNNKSDGGGGGGATTNNNDTGTTGTGDGVVVDEAKNYFKVKNDKLRKINNRLKVLQNLKTTEKDKDNSAENTD